MRDRAKLFASDRFRWPQSCALRQPAIGERKQSKGKKKGLGEL
jgi:hypothetical protein